VSACVVGHITVRDAEKWAQYRAQVPATLAPWNAELLFRGQLTAALDGGHRHTDLVIIRFPDRAAVDAWYASPAYQALIPLRNEAADMDLLVFTD
jgi:uncharacterized protein (DUF1330 family)